MKLTDHIFYRMILLLAGLYLPLLVSAGTSSYLKVYEIRCNDRVNPDVVDQPSLSWKISSERQGTVQQDWEVEIARSEDLLCQGKADVWRSGLRRGTQQWNVVPEGISWDEASVFFWRVRIRDERGNDSPWSQTGRFVTGLKNEQSWKAKWITTGGSADDALPYFRKVINAGREGATLVRALVFLCGLGCSELYLNGRQVDPERYLDPAQTNYEHYAFYTAFDITHLLREGENCLGVMTGNGWFAQNTGWQGAPFSYGVPMLRLQLVIDYSDGTRLVSGSDESWTWQNGPVVKSNIYLGECYDARKEIAGWSEPGSSCSGWKAAVEAGSGIPPLLKPQPIEPIRKKQVLKARKMWQGANGDWIFDFGQNTAGIPMLCARQPEGTRLLIRIAEEVNEKGEPDFRSLGWIHHGKIFTDEYVCRGGDTERWTPRFTYHGFRYAALSGYQGKPDSTVLSLVRVHTDLEMRGTFSCSDPQVNRLHELALNTVLSNLHGIPTDCPNREKCGWLGDTHAYVKMANMNLDMNNFWVKYLNDIRSGADIYEQKTLFHERYNNTFYFTEKARGIPYMIAPGKRLCGVASPDWGTALVQLPWWLYVYYGNKDVLTDFYDSMKQWTDYVSTLGKDTARTRKYGRNTQHIIWQGLGDWCPPEYGKDMKTPVEFTSTAFHYLDVWIMEQTAQVLGRKQDESFYAGEKALIAAEMQKCFYDDQKKTFGSQTANVMALDLGLVPAGDEQAVARGVTRDMEQNSEGFINCGIFGIGRIGSMLARYGQSDASWELYAGKGENSFSHMWDAAGATSLWEVLPVNEKTRLAAAEVSHSHPMQAGYDICFFEDMAGIRPDISGPGFKVIRFDPVFTRNLLRAEATFESAYGRVLSCWENQEDEFVWTIRIPVNSSGLVSLPQNSQIRINGAKINETEYPVISRTDGKMLCHFPSGNFRICIKNK
ncbi:MAG: family 78 glycoside hydrolase catalytic domain [Mangrovibacterium sp.]